MSRRQLLTATVVMLVGVFGLLLAGFDSWDSHVQLLGGVAVGVAVSLCAPEQFGWREERPPDRKT